MGRAGSLTPEYRDWAGRSIVTVREFALLLVGRDPTASPERPLSHEQNLKYHEILSMLKASLGDRHVYLSEPVPSDDGTATYQIDRTKEREEPLGGWLEVAAIDDLSEIDEYVYFYPLALSDALSWAIKAEVEIPPGLRLNAWLKEKLPSDSRPLRRHITVLKALREGPLRRNELVAMMAHHGDYYSDSTIYRALKELKDEGFIHYSRQHDVYIRVDHPEANTVDY